MKIIPQSHGILEQLEEEMFWDLTNDEEVRFEVEVKVKNDDWARAA